MEQQLEKVTRINLTEDKDYSGISWADMPPEILANIFPDFRYNDLYSASLVNKKFNVIANLTLTELGNIVKEAKEQEKDLLIASCKSSPKFTQAVIMSVVEKKLSDEELIDIACTSLEHAEVILKSRLIYRSFKTINNDEMEQKKGEQSKIIESGTDKLDLDYSSIINSFSNLKLDFNFDNMDIEANLRSSIDIILAIANKNISFTKLVLKYACNALSGYNLMKIAKKSVDHIEAVFSNSDALARLKPGHILDIAKSSQSYLKYILLRHPEKINNAGIEQLSDVSKEYEKIVNSCLIPTVYRLPRDLVIKHPHLSLNVLNLLASEKFFSDINPVWVHQKQIAPTITAKIEHTINLYEHCFISPSLNKILIAGLIKESAKFAQVAFAHPKIKLILGQYFYDKLSNQLQNTLSERQQSEGVIPKFTK